LITFCFENNIVLCRLPSHTSHKLQPCDVGVFGPLKTAYRDNVERLYRGGANTVGKEHFTALYSRARGQALTSRNIKAGWAKAGLIPLNPDRVLSEFQQQDVAREAERIVPIRVDLPSPDGPLVTPVTADHLSTLRAKLEQDTHALDKDCRHRLQKAFKAAERLFAERALLSEENRMLFDQNNEKVSRTSIKPTVVGTAKIMSYDDILEAQRKREANEAAAPNRTRRGRKRPPSTASIEEKRMRLTEIEKGKQEIEVLGLGDYCSILALS
jgi:hypothetical protein